MEIVCQWQFEVENAVPDVVEVGFSTVFVIFPTPSNNKLLPSGYFFVISKRLNGGGVPSTLSEGK